MERNRYVCKVVDALAHPITLDKCVLASNGIESTITLSHLCSAKQR